MTAALSSVEASRNSEAIQNNEDEELSMESPSPIEDYSGGLVSRIGKTRFLVLMMLVLPLSLGAWVIVNSRLYDVSFIFGKDGRIKIRRKPFASTSASVPNKKKIAPRGASLAKGKMASQPMMMQLPSPPPPKPAPIPRPIPPPKPDLTPRSLPPPKPAPTPKPIPHLLLAPTPKAVPLPKPAPTPNPIPPQKSVSPSKLDVASHPKAPFSSKHPDEDPIFTSIKVKRKKRSSADVDPVRKSRGAAIDVVPSTDTAQKRDGWFRSIRLRRRSAEEKAPHIAARGIAPPKQKPKAEGGLFSSIRLRKRSPEERATHYATRVITPPEPKPPSGGGFFSRIRLRKRSAEERAAYYAERGITPPEPKPPSEGGFFTRIRLRRRSPEERAQYYAARGITPPEPKPPSEGGLFSRIRLRRRSAEEKAARKATASSTATEPNPLTPSFTQKEQQQDVETKPLVSKKDKGIIVKQSKSKQGGLFDLFGGIRVKRADKRTKFVVEEEPVISFLEIRFRTRRKKKSQATRGIKMRQPSIEAKRQAELDAAAKAAKEEARRASKAAAEARRDAQFIAKQEKAAAQLAAREEKKAAQKAKREAAILELKIKREKQQAEQEAIVVEAKMKREKIAAAKKAAREDAVLAASMKREEIAAERARIKEERKAAAIEARQAKDDQRMADRDFQKLQATMKELSRQRELDLRKMESDAKKMAAKAAKAENKAASSPKKGLFRALRFRRRSAEERRLAKELKKEKSILAKKLKKKSWFRSIRLRRKPKKVKETKPKIKEVDNSVVKQKSPTTTSTPIPSEQKSQSWSLFSQGDSKQLALAVFPLVEKNAPEKVLPELIKHLAGQGEERDRPRARSIRSMIVDEPDSGQYRTKPRYTAIRVRDSKPKPVPPKQQYAAIRIRRVKHT